MSDLQQQVEELRATPEPDRGAAHQPDPAAPVNRGYVAKIDGHYIARSKDPRQLERVRRVRSPREAEPFPNQVEAVKAAGPAEIVTVEPAPERMGCPCYAEALALLLAAKHDDDSDLAWFVAQLYGVTLEDVREDVANARAP